MASGSNVICSYTMVECDARKVSNYFQESLEQGAIKLSCQENEHRKKITDDSYTTIY